VSGQGGLGNGFAGFALCFRHFVFGALFWRFVFGALFLVLCSLFFAHAEVGGFGVAFAVGARADGADGSDGFQYGVVKGPVAGAADDFYGSYGATGTYLKFNANDEFAAEAFGFLLRFPDALREERKVAVHLVAFGGGERGASRS
jgi:hypothetical protein